MNVKRRRKLWAAGVIAAGVTGLYFYQPQRLDLFPRPAPDPNPRIDPDTSSLFSSKARVAVISAHPDDTEFYLGGTLTKLGRAGAQILLIVCTDGDKGYYPSFMTNPTENRRVRRLEQLAAAKAYGAQVVFLAKPDGRLHADGELEGELRSHLDEFQPDYVLAFDPDYPPRIQHNDHLQSGVAAAVAIQGLKSLRGLLRYSTHAPNYYVDISPDWPQKELLLAMHASQFYGDRLDRVKGMLQSMALSQGQAIGVHLAESFRVTQMKE